MDAATLDQRLGDANWVVFDCRHDLTQSEWGNNQYAQGHIAGALFAHVDNDLSGKKTGNNGRHPLPDAVQLQDFFRAAGINSDSQIVAYDAHGEIGRAHV